MKKLLMAVACVCAAAGVQAASISWSSNDYKLTDKDGTILNTEASLDNIVLVNLGSSCDWSNATIIPTGSGNKQTTMTIGTQATSQAKAGKVSGKATFSYDTVDTSNNLINNGDYLALMFEDKEGNLAKLTYTSGADKGKLVTATYLVDGIANASTALTGKKIAMTGNFAAVDTVPEPTSAMLLLLGMAGLALRRRRA